MRTLFAALGFLLFTATSSQAAERRYPFERIQLDNGLTVISLEDFSCPIAAVQVWYHVGSKNEEPHRQGFAHMFEHMMFRGTDRLNETAHFDNIRRVGGDCNAYTSFDNTTYIQVVPADQVEMVLWLESERMAFLKIDQKGFDTERRVVEEELRMGHNAPYGRVPEKLLGDIYGTACYGWTPGGQIADLRAASIDELAAFWNKYYVPNNATLVVVGAIKHADVQKLAHRYFDWIPHCPDPKPPEAPGAGDEKARTIKISEDKGPLPILGALYRIPPEKDADYLPLEIGMGILGGGESSRLYVDVVRDKKIAQIAMAGAFGFELDGMCGAGGLLLPFGKKKELMAEVKEQIKTLRESPVSERELTKLKNELRRGEIDAAETVAAKASKLGDYAVLWGDAERINRRLAEIDAVTIPDVQRVAEKYLANDRRMSVLVEPSATGMLSSLLSKSDKDAQTDQAAASDKENRVAPRMGCKASAKRPADFPSTPPEGKLSGDFVLGAHEAKKLSNGLEVVCVPNRELPLVEMELDIRSGSWTEEKPGAANATMALMSKATKAHDAKALAELLAFNAIHLGASSSMDTADVSMSAMLPQLELGASLLRDVVENPTFPADEYDIQQKQTKMGLMISSRQPEYVAEREFRRRLYGSHPYSRTTTGELEDLDKIKIEDLKQWWTKNVRPENAVLYVSGDIDPQAAFKLAEKHFGSWKVEGTFTAAKLPSLDATGATHIYLVDRPGSVQSQIRVGHLGVTRKDEIYPAAKVLSNILGGGFNSRLNKAIRVEKGLTYGARGGFSPRRFAGDFEMSTFTKTPKTADTLKTLLGEVEKIRSSEPTATELADTKTYMQGAMAREQETASQVVSKLWMIETEGLPKNYFTEYLERIRTTSGADVLGAAKKLIDPTKLSIVVVGEAKAIKADLEKIAPVTVVNQTTSMPADSSSEGGEN